MHKGIGWVLAAGFVTTSPAAAVGYCAHRAERQATLDAAGATRVEVVARAGSLRITGRPGVKALSATGTACASDAGQLAEVRISATRQGATLRIEALVPEARGAGASNTLDLAIDVPDSLPLQVDDTSGSLEVRGVAALELSDSSGEILVENVAGAVSVRDSSGEMHLDRVGGDVRVSESSGEIEVTRVGGSVEVEEDSSGDIRVADVKGSVLVRRDSSGGIDVREVGGDFRVDHDGSGGIQHAGVRGRVSLPKGK